jgi:hypothetical protein
MSNKSLSKREISGLAKFVVAGSLLIVSIRVLFMLAAVGVDATLQRWPIELGFLVLMILLMSITAIVAICASRYLKKK